MRRFVARQNLQRFQHLLRSEENPAECAQLERLIEEARTDLRYLERIWTWSWPGVEIAEAAGEVLQETLDDLLDRLEADLGVLQGVDRTDGALRLIWQRGFDADAVSRLADVRTCDPAGWASVLQDGTPFVVEDAQTGPCPREARVWARSHDIRAIHALPVTDGRGEPVGIFSATIAPLGLMTTVKRNSPGRRSGPSLRCCRGLAPPDRFRRRPPERQRPPARSRRSPSRNPVPRLRRRSRDGGSSDRDGR